MTTFLESAVAKKLGELNSSQKSIETLSLWLIHHRKHFQTIVKTWYKELVKAPIKRKILFMYLANDVIQNSRKKGPEYCNEFGFILPIAIHHMAGFHSLDAKSRGSLERIIKIWGKRGMYETGQIEEFKKALKFRQPVKDGRRSLKNGDKKQRGPRKPSGDPPEDDEIICIFPVNDEEGSHEDEDQKKKKKKTVVDSPAECNKKTVKSEIKPHVQEKNETQVKISPCSSSGIPPDPDEVIRALLDLENSTLANRAFHEAMAYMVPEITEDSLKETITDKTQAKQHLQYVGAASLILSNFNGRLDKEMEDRKKVLTMLRELTIDQLNSLSDAKERLEKYQEILQSLRTDRQEVRSDVQNLPDIN